MGEVWAVGQDSSQLDPHAPHLSPSWSFRPQESGKNNRKDGSDMWDSETTSHLSSEAPTHQRQARRVTGMSAAGAGFTTQGILGCTLPTRPTWCIYHTRIFYIHQEICALPFVFKYVALSHLSLVFLCLMEMWISRNSFHSSSFCTGKPAL